MSDITLWSTNPADNTLPAPNGFPEGMAPSTVDDACREVMAAVRRFVEDGGWFNWGHTYTYISSTSFSVTGNLSSTYHIGRRVRAMGATTGTIYGTITNSVYTTLTTVTVSWDAGSMNNETLAISLGYLEAYDSSVTGVTLTGDQTIGGVKTFTSFPVTPSSPPLTDYQVANKKYVDDSLSITPSFSPTIVRNTQAAAYAMLAIDKSKVIDCSGTWTLTALACGIAGNGFYCWVRNSGSGIITFASAGDLIYYQQLATGTTSLKIYANQALLFETNGVDWRVISSMGMGSPGEIRMTGRSTAPDGWLMCDGTAYDRNTYTGLFEAISTTYGAPGGNYFNVPNLRQRFPLGKAASGTGSTLGASGGLIDHTHGLTHSHALAYTSYNLMQGDNFPVNSCPALTSDFAGTTGTNNPPYLVVNYIIKF